MAVGGQDPTRPHIGKFADELTFAEGRLPAIGWAMNSAVTLGTSPQASREEAKSPVSSPASDATTSAVATDFGPNEWLVHEIWQQYQTDPESVSPEWREFLSDYQPDPIAPAPPTNGRPAAEPARPMEPDANGAAQRPRPARRQRHPSRRRRAGPTQRRPAAPAKPAMAPARRRPGRDRRAQHPAEGRRRPRRRQHGASLEVPTATSVRAVPAKLLQDNRTVINRHLARARGGKVSFTHLIGYALVRALVDHPEMNASFAEVDGKPALVTPEHIGLGLAIDLVKGEQRQLVVASIKNAERLDFSGFWIAYEDIVRRARNGKLTTDDFAGTTISLTNPGGIGTVHSVPRLMQGQGTIIGVGAMEYPAEFQGASEETLARLGVSKIITLTSTYDHRDHPGRAVRRVPAPDAPAAARRRRLLRRRLRLAAHPVRAGALGRPTSPSPTRASSTRAPG